VFLTEARNLTGAQLRPGQSRLNERALRMARGSYFSSPLLLGFEEIERLLDRVNKTAHDGYPPYNIEQVGNDILRITLAVAGFDREALQVTMEDNQLVIRGKQAEEEDKTYLHRGIATRQFQRSFVLAEGIEVESANLLNGLLSIVLKRPQPETVVRTIEIQGEGNGRKDARKEPSTLNLVKARREES
jgi:HSP20 family molecular chaperone IbpA